MNGFGGAGAKKTHKKTHAPLRIFLGLTGGTGGAGDQEFGDRIFRHRPRREPRSRRYFAAEDTPKYTEVMIPNAFVHFLSQL